MGSFSSTVLLEMKILAVTLLYFLLPLALAKGFTDEEFEKHVQTLKKRLPSDKFTVIIQKPFVVIGDGSPKVLRDRWARGTVKWASEKLKEAYFPRDPDHILDVWLFKDKQSYEMHTEALWGKVPSTPYGYYSSSQKALVMNIATGGGTLVHEIVHPFIEANFPECPPWFNEGLGSLYEQSVERNGTIWGLTNWRLSGLKTVIGLGKLPSFKNLMSMNERKFYGEHRGRGYSDNYAQSRYLLYYLQEKNLLRKYYQQFIANQSSDPTGYKTLQQVLGEEDMKGFQKRWESYALQLKYPEK